MQHIDALSKLKSTPLGWYKRAPMDDLTVPGVLFWADIAVNYALDDVFER